MVEEEIITIVRLRGSVALDRAIPEFGFTIRWLAAQVGVPHGYIVDWRKGRSVPTPQQQEVLERLFARKVARGRVVESAVPREWWQPVAKEAA